MLFSNLTDIPIAIWALAGLAVILARLVSLRYWRGLNKYDGPFLASFTNFWRASQFLLKRDRVYFEEVVPKYGRIVRLGPNTLLFTEPEAIKDIYTTGFEKSGFYMIAAGVSKGVVVPNVFSTIDKEWHAKLRRSVSAAFALSTLLQYEPSVTKTVKTFLEQIDARFAGKTGPEGVADLARWFQFFALDVVSELTYSSTYQMLETGKDNHGIIAARTAILDSFTVVNNVFWLDKWLYKNPILLWLGKIGWHNKVTPTVPPALKQIQARLKLLAGTKTSIDAEKPAASKPDLLSKFLNAKVEHPDVVDDRAVLGLVLSMVNAGSGTVSTTLAAIFYYTLKNPQYMENLVQEIDAYFPQPEKFTSLEQYQTPYTEAQKLPYLDAAVKETFRFHPGLGAQLSEQVVPKGGAMIAGDFIPGGTIVSVNGWTVQRHKPTYGDDALVFRPERWLEADAQKLSAMNRGLFVFGAGPNTCIGKNIGLLEIFKIVPSVLRAFTVELDDPSKSWHIYNLGDPEPSQFYVRFKPRYVK